MNQAVNAKRRWRRMEACASTSAAPARLCCFAPSAGRFRTASASEVPTSGAEWKTASQRMAPRSGSCQLKSLSLMRMRRSAELQAGQLKSKNSHAQPGVRSSPAARATYWARMAELKLKRLCEKSSKVDTYAHRLAPWFRRMRLLEDGNQGFR